MTIKMTIPIEKDNFIVNFILRKQSRISFQFLIKRKHWNPTSYLPFMLIIMDERLITFCLLDFGYTNLSFVLKILFRHLFYFKMKPMQHNLSSLMCPVLVVMQRQAGCLIFFFRTRIVLFIKVHNAYPTIFFFEM